MASNAFSMREEVGNKTIMCITIPIPKNAFNAKYSTIKAELYAHQKSHGSYILGIYHGQT